MTSKEVHKFFDVHVNAAPEQGTLKIRTEEDILVTMGALYPLLRQIGHCKGKWKVYNPMN